MMELSPSRRKVLILDCCFSGAVGKAFRSGIDDQLNMMSSGGGTYIMTASTAIETAQEKEGDDYGLFTKHLIRGISDGEADRDGDGYITIDELYDYAYEGVVEEGAQKPTKYCRNVEGDIYISRTGRDPRQDRAKKLKALLFKLNSANDIPDELFLQAHEVISRKRAELTDMQREQEVLLDQLLQGKLKPSEFTWKWARPQLRDTPPPKPAPRTTQFLAQLLTPRPAEEAHAKLIERIGEFRRLGRLVGEVMITGQFDKFRGKKDD